MKLLITGAWNCTDRQLDSIRTLGHEVVFLQNEKDELPCAAHTIEGVICNGLFLYHDIEKFTSLRYIQLTSAGYDRVPVKYIEEHGIKINNARGVYSIPMAEFAVSGVLQLYKQSRFFYDNQKKQKWEKRRDLLELCGKTVLILGCGNVGTECAKKFNAFGCKVYGIDVKPYDNGNFLAIYSLNVLDEKLSQADIVILTLPLTDKTKGLFDATCFEKLKNGAVLVNISRGDIVDENALINALDTKLFGAVIDVFSEEPLREDSPLWHKENAIITPHNSFVGENNGDRLFKLIIDNFEDING